MSEWRASQHARSGVTCEECHGGDPSAREAEAAHQGVLPSADPKSKVSPRNLPATCGSCHESQYRAYAETVHAKAFDEQGDAATCFTCHGSMATSYPSPRELRARCKTCHERPIEAYAALSWYSAAKRHLLRAHRAVDDARSVVPDWGVGAAERFHDLERRLRAVSIEWHQFDMEAVLAHSRTLLDLGELLEQEARLRIKMREEDEEEGDR